MRIQYASDIHLEFKSNSEFLKSKPLIVKGEYLILAGDITIFSDEYFKNPFFDWISDNFREVFIVPGNHEYYEGFDISKHENGFKHSIRKNVHWVNNHTENINGINLIFTTLWSKLDSKFHSKIVRCLSDFYRIWRNKETIEVSDYDTLHEKSLSFLKNSLKQNTNGKNVVITHHVPSQLCNPDKYKGSVINSAFVNSLDKLIESHNIDYWIYGHHHGNMPEISIGKTKLLTNQLGYIDYEEHDSFDHGAWFDV